MLLRSWGLCVDKPGESVHTPHAASHHPWLRDGVTGALQFEGTSSSLADSG